MPSLSSGRLLLSTAKRPVLHTSRTVHHGQPHFSTHTTEASLPALLSVHQDILETVHTTGLPWWATIVASTLVLRTSMTLPIAIYQQRSLGRRLSLAPMVQSWGETLKVSVAKESKERNRLQWGYEQINPLMTCQQYRHKVNALYAHHHCERWKLLLLPWVQIPLFVSMSLTLRHMAGFPLPWWGSLSEGPVHGWVEGGVGPWMDLTASDPTWIFPVLIGVGNLANVELNVRNRGPTTRTQRIISNALRCVSVALIPIASQVPMAIGLYWMTSSWYSVLQNSLFQVPTVRSSLGMPLLPSPKTAETSKETGMEQGVTK
ncbi:60Kd inner membrane protein-domain-containing protein [Spinellus fusiger]|nr:60Kd inner membrane protein-domain-containing protein [Spinellus fusiger]